jgi:hypothetical protein
MGQKVSKIHAVLSSDGILSRDEFVAELKAIEKIKELEAKEAEKLAREKRIKDDASLMVDPQAQKDWDRVVLQVAKLIVSDALNNSWWARHYGYFSVRPLDLFYYKGSYLKRSLDSLGLAKKWKYKENGYVEGSRTLHDYVRLKYDTSENKFILSPTICRYKSNHRYYHISDETLENIRKNENTLVHAISNELTRMFEEKGYTVENSIQLDRVKRTLYTCELTGALKIKLQ